MLRTWRNYLICGPSHRRAASSTTCCLGARRRSACPSWHTHLWNRVAYSDIRRSAESQRSTARLQRRLPFLGSGARDLRLTRQDLAELDRAFPPPTRPAPLEILA